MSQQPAPWGTKEWFNGLAKASVGNSALEYFSYSKNGYQKERIKTAVDFVFGGRNWRKAKSLLDVGCATGDLLKAVIVSKNLERVVGIDFSDEVIALARERSPTLEFSVGRFPGLMMEKSYDAVLLFEVLYYVAPEFRLEAFLELKGLLSQNGRIYFSSSLLGEPYLSEDELMKLVKESGLTIERVKKVNYRKVFFITSPLERLGRVVNQNQSDIAKSGMRKSLVKIFLGNKLCKPIVNRFIILVLESESLVRFFAKENSGNKNFDASHIYLELRN